MIAEKEARTEIPDDNRPVPLKTESEFNYEELFYSITNQASSIQYANEVFVRISKYEADEISDQPHSISRHPDMPRAVFDIFWEYLQRNKPVAAYMKNLAKDGSYYWVMAMAFPCSAGYFSIQLKPGSPLFETVRQIYSDTLRKEKELERSSGKSEAIRKSRKYLLSRLKAEGFSGYEEFMWYALQNEMSHREKVLEGFEVTGNHIIPEKLVQLDSCLTDLVISLEELKNIHSALVGHSDYILKLARSILVLSLNAQVGSAKLDQKDISLSVVAEKMGEQSVSGEKSLKNLKETISGLSTLIGNLNFDIISSKLQTEMTIDFMKEMDRQKHQADSNNLNGEAALNMLKDAFIPRVLEVHDTLCRVPAYLKSLLAGVKEIERFLLVLRFIHITGKVEVARMSQDAQSFATTFQDLVNEIQNAETHLGQLNDVLDSSYRNSGKFMDYKKELAGYMKDFSL